MNWLEEEIKLGSLNVSDISGIYKRAVEIDKNLLNNKEFISSWYKNGLEPIKYKIEENVDYRTKLLPMLDKEIYKIEDLDTFVQLIEEFTNAYLFNEEYKEMHHFNSRTSIPDIYNIFNENFLKDINEYDKDKLKYELYWKSGSLFKFWDLFNKTFKYNIIEYQKDYMNELVNLERLRKEVELLENRSVSIEEIKMKWWNMYDK